MTPAQFIEKRRPDWQELDGILQQIEYHRDASISARLFLRFARLYRSACTDLSLADTWRLPRDMREYLEGLVSRGHSNLYSYPRNRMRDIADFFLHTVPRIVYRDTYVRICVLAFYIPAVISGFLAYHSDEFAKATLGEATMIAFEEMHSSHETQSNEMITSAGFYVQHNTTLALIAFGMGILGGVGSLFAILTNAIFLGAVLGFLLTTPSAMNIINWIFAHAPFELTGLVLSAGAGLRIGFSMIAPGGRERMRALREEAYNSIPIISAAVLLIVLAAPIEAFLGPVSEPPMLYVKYSTGLFCLLLVIFYFIVLGNIRHREHNGYMRLLTAKKIQEPMPEFGNKSKHN